jgi:hypothetical protein
MMQSRVHAHRAVVAFSRLLSRAALGGAVIAAANCFTPEAQAATARSSSKLS